MVEDTRNHQDDAVLALHCVLLVILITSTVNGSVFTSTVSDFGPEIVDFECSIIWSTFEVCHYFQGTVVVRKRYLDKHKYKKIKVEMYRLSWLRTLQAPSVLYSKKHFGTAGTQPKNIASNADVRAQFLPRMGIIKLFSFRPPV